MKDLVIVGHGGLAREVAFLVEEINRSVPTWNLLGYISPRSAEVGRRYGNYTVCADDAWLSGVDRPIAAVLAIGDLKIMAAVRERLIANSNIEFPNLVHPAVTGDWGQITLAQGNLLFNGVSLTTDISIGSFNIVNPGCTLSHDCVLGSFNLLGPGVHLAGAVNVGDRVLLGTGAKLLPKVQVCDDVVVGAGAVVVNSIADPGTYVGVPSRRVTECDVNEDADSHHCL
jgi:sugar O-acyltransferase (sialic acid O-acetyltransferase NeuD family)